jgi:hypothetical protein
MDFKQFDTYILSPTLYALKDVMPNPGVAKTLVAETLWHESDWLQYVAQLPRTLGGPVHGLGFTQMERSTWDDLWIRFLTMSRFDAIRGAICAYCCYGDSPRYPDLTWNLRLAVAMTRLKYYSSPKLLPTDKLEARAAYWGRVYQGTSDPVKIALYIDNARSIPWE